MNPGEFENLRKREEVMYQTGMTVRMTIAVSMAQGLLSSIGNDTWTTDNVAEAAFEMADALIALETKDE